MPTLARLLLIPAALLTGAGRPAGASTLDEWGTATATGSFPCVAPCSVLDFLGMTVEDVDGGAGVLGAASELGAGNPNGTARAAVNVLGGLAIPQLKAEAYSTDQGGVSALAVGVQGYTYTGGGGTVTVSLDLTGSVHDALGSDLTRIEVIAAFFDPDPPVGDPFSLTDLMSATPLGALLALDLYTELVPPIELIEDATDTDIQNLGNTMTVTGLAPGDQFYLFAALLASADGAGQYADAFSTVSMSFTVGGGELLAAAVPLPGGAVLFASGLAALVMLRRRTGA